MKYSIYFFYILNGIFCLIWVLYEIYGLFSEYKKKFGICYEEEMVFIVNLMMVREIKNERKEGVLVFWF